MRFSILFLLASLVFPAVSPAQAPVFVITPEESTIKFYVKSSVDIGLIPTRNGGFIEKK
jgi:hypothetical protein